MSMKKTLQILAIMTLSCPLVAHNDPHAQDPDILTLHGFGAGNTAEGAKSLAPTLGLSRRSTITHPHPFRALRNLKIMGDPDLTSISPALKDEFNNIKSVEFGDKGDLLASSLGQGQEIAKIHTIVKNEIPHKKFMIVAHSRGGAAAYTYAGQHNPENLQGIVTYGAPSSMPQIVSDWMGEAIGSAKLGNVLLPLVSKYPWSDKTPLDSIKNIKNKELLIVIAHATHDSVVKQDHGKRLYDEFKKNNFKNLYWVPMTTGDHNHDIFVEHSSDTNKETIISQNKAYCTLSSIYKAHGLPHDPDFATLTPEELKAQFQPDTQLYQQHILTKGNVALIAIAGLSYYAWKKYKASKQIDNDTIPTAA